MERSTRLLHTVPQMKEKSSDQWYISLTANANILKLPLICQSLVGLKILVAATAEFCMKGSDLRGQ